MAGFWPFFGKGICFWAGISQKKKTFPLFLGKVGGSGFFEIFFRRGPGWGGGDGYQKKKKNSPWGQGLTFKNSAKIGAKFAALGFLKKNFFQERLKFF